MTGPGYYGKCPAKGDFIGQGLSRAFAAAWDGWLQQAISASRAELGEAWSDLYFHMPIWRFALPAGAFGPLAVIGAVMPSLDKVGRLFPLTAGVELDDGDLPRRFFAAGEWLTALEDALLLALGDEGLPACLAALDAMEAMPAAPAGASLAALLEQAAPGGVSSVPGGEVSWWWSLGAGAQAPVVRAAGALPAPQFFASLMTAPDPIQTDPIQTGQRHAG